MRKNSQHATSLREQSKSATKSYKYYSDNFNSQQPSSPKGLAHQIQAQAQQSKSGSKNQ